MEFYRVFKARLSRQKRVRDKKSLIFRSSFYSLIIDLGDVKGNEKANAKVNSSFFVLSNLGCWAF